MAIQFNDGAAYEEGMGRWSRLVGDVFLDWLAPPSGLRWLDVGCGSAAFTELVCQRCQPAEAHGIDPSEAQLAYASRRPQASGAVFQQGDATALPFAADRFGAAVMALVIFFVPEPAQGVAEMVRVVRPGGIVAAYAWDMLGGGFPLEPIHAELRAMGVPPPPLPPSAGASQIDTLRELWIGAGLRDVDAREIRVERTYTDFEDFWSKTAILGNIQPIIAAMTPDDADRLKQHVRLRLPVDDHGHLTFSSRANAVKGRVSVSDET